MIILDLQIVQCIDTYNCKCFSMMPCILLPNTIELSVIAAIVFCLCFVVWDNSMACLRCRYYKDGSKVCLSCLYKLNRLTEHNYQLSHLRS